MTKWCLVPNCTVTSYNNPEKRFIVLPKEEKRRRLWLLAARRDAKSISSKYVPYICEDHFNLEEDVDNWIKLKYYPGCKIILKPGVVPHIFECQPERRTAQPRKERPTSAKRARRHLLEGLMSSVASTSTSVSDIEENILPHPGQELIENSTLPVVLDSTSNEECRTSSQIPLSPHRTSVNVSARKREIGFSSSGHHLSPHKRHTDNTDCTSPSDRCRQPFVVTSTSHRPAKQPSTEESSPFKGRHSVIPTTWRPAEALCKLQEEPHDKGRRAVIVQSAYNSVSCNPHVRSTDSQSVMCALVNEVGAEYKSVASLPFKSSAQFYKIAREESIGSTDENSSVASDGSSSCSELVNTTCNSFSEDRGDIRISDVRGWYYDYFKENSPQPNI